MKNVSGSDAGCSGGKPHHISSIAHLFFGDRGTEPAPAAGAGIFVAVVSLDDGRLAAYTAAGLATVAGYPVTRAARCKGRSPEGSWPRDGAQVILREATDERWSVRSFLDDMAGEGDTAGPGLPSAFLAQRPASSLLGRILDLPGPDFEKGTTDVGPDLHVINCGTATGEDGLLAALGRRRNERHPAGPTLAGLIVAVTTDQADRWQTALRVGQLAAHLEPTGLDILVFPDNWRRRGASDNAAAAVAEPNLLRRRCRSLLQAGEPIPDWRLSLVEPAADAQNNDGNEAWLVDVVARLF